MPFTWPLRNKRSMRILVTGGAGFIGSHVVDAYLADGHEVAVLDNLEGGSRENLNPRAHFFDADIRDARLVAAAFGHFRPDVVSHHAAHIHVVRSLEDPAYDAEVNIVGSLNVWKAACDHGARRFVFASSGGAIYGPPKALPVSEAQTPAPLSPYGLSKWAFERFLMLPTDGPGPVPVILRYANVYGPRQGSRGEAGVISIFARRLLEGRPCMIYGDGTMTRDYVFVADIVAANQVALFGGDRGVFNIGTGEQTSTRHLFHLLCDLTGRAGTQPEYTPERGGEVRRICLDAAKARRELGWAPKHTLTDGLVRVVSSLGVPSPA